MQFTDNTTLANTRLTSDGYLVGNVACAKVGVQQYHGSEIGKGDGLVNVYRDESEVFALDSLASFVFLNHLCDGERLLVRSFWPAIFLNHLCDGERTL